MQILANALPGFRDLRAPVVAGYAWVLFAWLIVQPDLDRRPAGSVGGTLYDLGGEIGHVGIAIAVSVLAYFVGSLSQMCSPLLRALWGKVLEGLWWMLPVGLDDAIGVAASPKLPEGEEIDQIAARTATTVAKAVDLSPDHPRFPDVAGAASRARAEARAELALPATLLVGKEPELFAEVDRLRAEGELRLAVVPPFIALVCLLAASTSRWFLIALLPIVALLDQGVRTLNSSRQLVADAKARRLVSSQALERFRRWAEVVEGDPQAALRPEPERPRERQVRRGTSQLQRRAQRLTTIPRGSLRDRIAMLHRLGPSARQALRVYAEDELRYRATPAIVGLAFPPPGANASATELRPLQELELIEQSSPRALAWTLTDEGIEIARLLTASLPDDPTLRAELESLRDG